MLDLVIANSIPELVAAEREVIRYLGGNSSNEAIPDSISQTIIQMRRYGSRLAKPRFVYRILPITQLDFNSHCLDHLWQCGEYAAIVICTIGAQLENQVAEFFSRREYLKGVVLDAVGSALAESLTEYIAQTLRDQCLKRGYSTSIRYSPGYGDWDLSEQQKIFHLLDSSSIAVELNDSWLMHPLKSVSFISVIGKQLPPLYQTRRKCDWCRKRDCQFKDKRDEFQTESTRSN